MRWLKKLLGIEAWQKKKKAREEYELRLKIDRYVHLNNLHKPKKPPPAPKAE